MKTKIQSLLQQLNQGLVEREHVLKLAMLTTLAGENLVLVGPPGTGKSLVARRIANSLSHEGEDGAGYFEYLLTKFSTPEELFGPLSIAALKNDRFHRNTEGYLPTVRMAFLDEIFKASSSILNALLTVLNERVYHNGTEVQKVPLQALIAASNELPTDQEELAALYDRFLVRVFVDYVGANNLPRLFETTTEPTLRTGDMLSAADLARVRQAADQVVFEPALIQAVQDIWAAHKEAFKEDRRESLSDRRLKKVIHLMRVSAATNGREAVDLSDVMLLKDCLWNHADNVGKVQALVIKTLQRHSRQVPVAEVARLAGPGKTGHTLAPAYELGGDGKTLVPVKSSAALAVRSTTSLVSSGGGAKKTGAVVKGYSGSGTADDPLLIQTVDDLLDLTRPEVGQKGYYFRQTADIDISGVSTWPEIAFNGHFDGRQFTISDRENRWLFSRTTASRFTNVWLKKCRLASLAANKCEFFACKTSTVLVSIVESSNLTACESGERLISNKASDCSIISCLSGNSIAGTTTDCKVHSCQSIGTLISSKAKTTKITDCMVIFENNKSNYFNAEEISGISEQLIESSVECCFITGMLSDSDKLCGITRESSNSTIKQCALGRLTTIKAAMPISHFIAEKMENSAVEKNIAIDDIKNLRQEMIVARKRVASVQNQPLLKIHPDFIAAAQFKQRYFEHTQGWDFDNVWIWDAKNDRPALRQVGVSATPSARGSESASSGGTVDLLTQQVTANIWL